MSVSKKSDWTPLPPDMVVLVGFYFMLLFALLLAFILPALSHLRQRGVAILFMPAVASGIVGTVLLFFARLPLYRQRQFFTFGPRRLDRAHRRLYWLAYLFVGVSVALLLLLLAGVRR